MQTTFVFFMVALAAILILTIFSYVFIGKVLVPVEEAYRKQDEFISVASHELKAPLTIIKSCIYSLSASSGTDISSSSSKDNSSSAASNSCAVKQTDSLSLNYVALADKECSHMSRIVDDLLSFARIKQADRGMFEPTDPADIIIECYSRFEALAMRKGLSLQVILPEEPLAPISMNRERMIQCISILIDNAIEYTDEGNITLSIFRAHENRPSARNTSKIVFQVRDTGIGVPDELKEKIFEKFYSAHRKSGATVSSHAGLGLAIADEIARLHRAGITVRDNEPRGSVFEVRL